MTKVLHILPDLGSGGAERMAVNLMRGLDRDRFEVGAVSLFDPAGSELEGALAQNDIPVWYLGKRRGLDLRMFGRVARVLKSFRPHVVHTHRYVLRYALPSMLSCRVPARVHTVHNIAEKEVDRPGRWVHRAAFRCGVTPVAIAEEVSDSLYGLYGTGDSPLIPNGIPVDEYRRPSLTREVWRERKGFSPEDVLFVCVARLSRQKNPMLLLESFARGPASDPRSHLLFVGEGELSSGVEERARSLGLQDRVHILGVSSDVPGILNAADAFVLASDWEGNPLSVMEAMAAGKPVISTAVGGVPELIEDGRSGLLVPRGDAETLSRAMSYLLETPKAREGLGKASLERAVELFDARTMTRAYEELYESILAKN